MSYKTAISKLINHEDLEAEEVKSIISAILSEEMDPIQSSAFLTALRMKGEKEEEILGVAEALKEKMVMVKCKDRENLVDTCGTGGDGKSTFNISTAEAFVAAAGGFRVAKHGNRSVTSSSGSADVLVSLGINITSLTPKRAEEALKKIGITFLFAPFFHPAMKAVAPVRQKLGFRTIFNIIGPLVNPAGPVTYHTMGVFSPDFVKPVAKVLKKLGVKKAAVFSSYDGLDEISPFAPTRAIIFDEEKFEEVIIQPEQLGMKHSPEEMEEIIVTNPEESASLIKAIFTGEAPEVAKDMTILNSGMLFYLRNGGALADGVAEAKEILNSFKPLEKLNQLIGFSQKEEVTG